MLGTSGRTGIRFALVTAKGLNLPDLINSITDSTEPNIKLTWPPRVSVTAGPVPL